jgi:hypothetical protein
MLGFVFRPAIPSNCDETRTTQTESRFGFGKRAGSAMKKWTKNFHLLLSTEEKEKLQKQADREGFSSKAAYLRSLIRQEYQALEKQLDLFPKRCCYPGK